MTGIDIGFGLIVLISAFISFVRGFFTEAVSLLTWVAALVISTLFAHQFGSLFKHLVEDDLARGVIAWLVLFLGTLLIGGLINYLFSKLRTKVKRGPMDRTIGLFFGIARGVLIIALIMLLAHLDFLTSLRESELWNTSVSVPYFSRFASAMHGFLPAQEAAYFDFGGN